MPNIVPRVQAGDLMTAAFMNEIIDAINGQYELLLWECPYCATLNSGKALECRSCRASRPGVKA